MSSNTDLIAMEADKLDREAKAQSEASERLRRRQERETYARRIRAEHAAEMARPFISRDLLSDDERAEIRNRLRGRQRWFGLHHTTLTIEE